MQASYREAMYAPAAPEMPGFFTDSRAPQCSGALSPFSTRVVTKSCSMNAPPKVQAVGLFTGSFTCKHQSSQQPFPSNDTSWQEDLQWRIVFNEGGQTQYSQIIGQDLLPNEGFSKDGQCSPGIR